MTDFLTNADHWRKRAEQTRALAANAVKDQGRLLKVAEEYDRLGGSRGRTAKCSPDGQLRAVKPARIICFIRTGPGLQGPFLLKGHFRSGKWRAPPRPRGRIEATSAAYAAIEDDLLIARGASGRRRTRAAHPGSYGDV